MGNELNRTREVYERLWTEAISAFERNDLELDLHLPQKRNDVRRGVTLAIRPTRTVQNSINAFLRELSAAAPGQYFYQPEEFHVTVLSIISGSEFWRKKIHHLPAFKTIIGEVLSRHRKFSIAFQGVTASRGAVMIQGFPSDDTLQKIRNDLRETLRQNNFGAELDVRYKIKSAHITVMRFCKPQADCNRLVTLLKANRNTHFGEASVESFELIFGDWYASAKVARTLQTYPLKA